MIDGLSLIVDMSVGISRFPDDSADQEVLLKRADIAMDLAKQKKQHYMVYDEDMDTLSPRRLGLIGRVKEALANKEFEIYYQPVLSKENLRLKSFEALIRWPQSDGGFIPPGEFIPANGRFRHGLFFAVIVARLSASNNQARYVVRHGDGQRP